MKFVKLKGCLQSLSGQEAITMKKLICFTLLILSPFVVLIGQNNQQDIDAVEKKLVIDALCKNLDQEYIFPGITEKYIFMLKANFQSGKYDGIKKSMEFANELTKDMMGVHKDLHLSVRYNPGWIKNEKKRKELDENEILLKKRRNRAKNYGFEEIKILPANIGYLKFNGFSYDTDAYNTAIGVMGFLANTDALIIDLRENGGGSPEMVQFLCSYFLDNPRKHLNSFSYKDKEKLTQYWTYTYLPGKRLNKVNLYLLTSNRTFSAAEEFAYNLKSMKRAVVVGETTGGGAHDNKTVILSDNFMMSLPFARAINPVTKSNWEEVGVEPDVKVSRKKALETALVLASKKLAEKEKNPQLKSFYQWHSEAYKAEMSLLIIDKKVLQSYVGMYGPRKITFEGDSLFYQRGEGAKMKMIPISDDYFMFSGNHDFRLKFLKKENQIIGIKGSDINGFSDMHLKNK